MESLILNLIGNDPVEIFSFGVFCGFFIILPLTILLFWLFYEILDLIDDWNDFKEYRLKKNRKSCKK